MRIDDPDPRPRQVGGLRSRLTYANVMSTIAVFAVLGGGAYAASKIGPKDIKKGAVRAKAIKKGAVRSKAIKKNAVKAKHVRPGQVHSKHLRGGAVDTPSLADGAVTGAKIAAGAVEARHLNGVSIIARTKAAPTPGATAATARDAAPETPLFQRGELMIYGKCYLDTSGPTLYAGTYAKTSVDGATLDGYDVLTGGASAAQFLNTTTPETQRRVSDEESVGADTARGDNGFSGGSQIVLGRFTLGAPSGALLHGSIVRGVKQGNAPFGGGAFGPADGCTWSGYVIG